MRIEPLPVLMYHFVGELTGPYAELGVPARSLADQLHALADNGYQLLGLTEAVARKVSGARDRVVALTFDDGYATFGDALPILQSLGARATLFVCPNAVGRHPSWLRSYGEDQPALLNWNDLRELGQAGMEIGNHGLDHLPLDVLPDAEVQRQTALSRQMITDELGSPPTSFCYPHGYHSARTRSLVQAAGHQTACVIGHAVSPLTDLMRISRIMVRPSIAGPELASLVSGRRDPKSYARSFAYPAWRLARIGAYRCTGKILT